MANRKRQLFFELIDEVRRSQSATARFDQAVADAMGVNRTDMRCVDVIEREGAVPAGRLAEVTGLTSGAITTVIDRLERAGIARRVRDDGDRRRVLVELTPSAREQGRDYYSAHVEQSEVLYRRYSEAQIELLLEFVRRGREFNEVQAARLEAENRAPEAARPSVDARRGSRRATGGGRG
jgi:DNA-binding MarR family transcriptional regulator